MKEASSSEVKILNFKFFIEKVHLDDLNVYLGT